MNATDNIFLQEEKIKRLIVLFIIGLVLSGVTAFPIEWQLSIAHHWIGYFGFDNELTRWLDLVYEGVKQTNLRYPFMSYGTDWLAFAHLVIAIAFIGPLRDPVKNIWVIEFGMMACAAIFPLAFIAGAVRGVPVYWRLLDCSFGIVGGFLLWRCHHHIRHLERVLRLDSY